MTGSLATDNPTGGNAITGTHWDASREHLAARSADLAPVQLSAGYCRAGSPRSQLLRQLVGAFTPLLGRDLQIVREVFPFRLGFQPRDFAHYLPARLQRFSVEAVLVRSRTLEPFGLQSLGSHDSPNRIRNRLPVRARVL